MPLQASPGRCRHVAAAHKGPLHRCRRRGWADGGVAGAAAWLRAGVAGRAHAANLCLGARMPACWTAEQSAWCMASLAGRAQLLAPDSSGRSNLETAKWNASSQRQPLGSQPSDRPAQYCTRWLPLTLSTLCSQTKLSDSSRTTSTAQDPLGPLTLGCKKLSSLARAERAALLGPSCQHSRTCHDESLKGRHVAYGIEVRGVP